METVKTKGNGRSARRRAMDRNKNVLILGVILFINMMLISCNEKSKGQDFKDRDKNTASVRNSVNKPKVNIHVNKHYDDNGNVIGFDSTYSSYYSNIEGDTMKTDSLFQSFDRYFDTNHSLFFKDRLNNLFFNDSLGYPDFFHKDYFMRRYELNDDYFKDMMQRMDSIKNRFYQNESNRKKNSAEL
jgi:hypothetical protein